MDPLGGVDLQRRCFSVKMYAKMKELGPVGGGVCAGHAPRSANGPGEDLAKGSYWSFDVIWKTCGDR